MLIGRFARNLTVAAGLAMAGLNNVTADEKPATRPIPIVTEPDAINFFENEYFSSVTDARFHHLAYKNTMPSSWANFMESHFDGEKFFWLQIGPGGAALKRVDEHEKRNIRQFIIAAQLIHGTPKDQIYIPEELLEPIHKTESGSRSNVELELASIKDLLQKNDLTEAELKKVLNAYNRIEGYRLRFFLSQFLINSAKYADLKLNEENSVRDIKLIELINRELPRYLQTKIDAGNLEFDNDFDLLIQSLSKPFAYKQIYEGYAIPVPKSLEACQWQKLNELETIKALFTEESEKLRNEVIQLLNNGRYQELVDMEKKIIRLKGFYEKFFPETNTVFLFRDEDINDKLASTIKQTYRNLYQNLSQALDEMDLGKTTQFQKDFMNMSQILTMLDNGQGKAYNSMSFPSRDLQAKIDAINSSFYLSISNVINSGGSLEDIYKILDFKATINAFVDEHSLLFLCGEPEFGATPYSNNLDLARSCDSRIKSQLEAALSELKDTAKISSSKFKEIDFLASISALVAHESDSTPGSVIRSLRKQGVIDEGTKSSLIQYRYSNYINELTNYIMTSSDYSSKQQAYLLLNRIIKMTDKNLSPESLDQLNNLVEAGFASTEFSDETAEIISSIVLGRNYLQEFKTLGATQQAYLGKFLNLEPFPGEGIPLLIWQSDPSDYQDRAGLIIGRFSPPLEDATLKKLARLIDPLLVINRQRNIQERELIESRIEELRNLSRENREDLTKFIKELESELKILEASNLEDFFSSMHLTGIEKFFLRFCAKSDPFWGMTREFLRGIHKDEDLDAEQIYQNYLRTSTEGKNAFAILQKVLARFRGLHDGRNFYDYYVRALDDHISGESPRMNFEHLRYTHPQSVAQMLAMYLQQLDKLDTDGSDAYKDHVQQELDGLRSLFFGEMGKGRTLPEKEYPGYLDVPFASEYGFTEAEAKFSTKNLGINLSKLPAEELSLLLFAIHFVDTLDPIDPNDKSNDSRDRRSSVMKMFHYVTGGVITQVGTREGRFQSFYEFDLKNEEEKPKPKPKPPAAPKFGRSDRINRTIVAAKKHGRSRVAS